MLKNLKIENLAIIDKVDLDFEDGFIVLTGETGAGKSIIISAINFLLGEKTNIEMIRDGAEYLLAQGTFLLTEDQINSLEKYDLDIEDNKLIVKRQLNINGKSKITINDIRVTLQELKEIMSCIVDIVGQHSNQMLLNKSNYINLLDGFLRSDTQEIKRTISRVVSEYNVVKKKLDNLESDKKDSEEKREFYEYQLNELERLNLKENEEENLEKDYKRLFNANQIKESLEETISLLNSGNHSMIGSLKIVSRNIEKLSEYDENYEDLAERVNNLYYELEDCVYNLEKLSYDLDIDDNTLENISNRLDSLKSARKKYNKSIPELIKYRDEINKKLNDLDVSEFEIKELLKKVEEKTAEYNSLSDELSKIRKEVAKKLENKLVEELKFLNMEDVKIKIDFKEKDSIDFDGKDDIEILISTNAGQNLRPIHKVASCGEISRVLLALKVIFSKVDQISLLVFDEIDTGVGGDAARKIANKIKEISQNNQVISITHSASVAAMANQHFFIEKLTENNKTKTTVKLLNYEERVKEISRMLVGDDEITDVFSVASSMIRGE